jgi:hypothetical protein
MGIDYNQAREWGLGPNSYKSRGTFSPPIPGMDAWGLNLQQQNEAVLKWSSMVQRYLRGAATLFTKGKEGTVLLSGRTERKLDASIIGSTKRYFGVIDRVTYTFERHGVFVHKGVGRGYQLQGGVVRRVAKSKSTEVRQPAEWFNPVLDQTLPELSNKLAEINADAVLKATGMMIK